MTDTMTETTAAVPASLVERFYTALAEGRLTAEQCIECGALIFPPTGCCDACGSFTTTGITLSGRGTMLFASHNVAPACHPRFNPYAPYIYAQVRLEEGIYTSGMLLGVAGTPEEAERLYEAGPAEVTFEVLRTEDLPVVAFRLV